MPLIAEIAIPCPLRKTFDYLIEFGVDKIKLGSRVKVPFGSRHVIGFVLKIKEVQEVDLSTKLKSISDCIDEQPIISNSLFNLIQWTSDYYHHPIGDCYQVALPKKIRLGDENRLKKTFLWSLFI